MRSFLLLTLLVLLALPAEAQQRARVTTNAERADGGVTHTDNWRENQAVPVVQVSLARAPRDAASGLATGRRQHRPVALTNAQRASLLLQGQGGGTPNAGNTVAAAPPPVLSHLRLTPRRPFTALGHLQISGPVTIDFSGDHAFINLSVSNPNPAPRVSITAELEGGERYLLDFLIDPSDSGTYTIEGPGGMDMAYDIGVTDEHLLMLVEPQQSGDYTFTLKPPYGEVSAFRFYSVELSKLE
ncbi:MAG: hypothetical protein HKN04_05770 [Rhodothermaceae bacterium]|nr:hypothetical protein [Rhodothermaceae bacterium]